MLDYMVRGRFELILEFSSGGNEIVFYENLLRLGVLKNLCFCNMSLMGIVGDLCEFIRSFMMVLSGLSCLDLYL